MRMAFGTALALFHRWRAAGRTPDALRLRYDTYRPDQFRVSKGLLASFLSYCSSPRVQSFQATWREFAAKCVPPPPVTSGTIARYFSAGQYRALQSQLIGSSRAEAVARELVSAAKQRIAIRLRVAGWQGCRKVTATLVLRFMDSCAVPSSLSLSSAWRSFCRQATKPPAITYGAVRHYFTSAQHRAIQREFRKAYQARQEFWRLRDEAERQIRARLTHSAR